MTVQDDGRTVEMGVAQLSTVSVARLNNISEGTQHSVGECTVCKVANEVCKDEHSVQSNGVERFLVYNLQSAYSGLF